MTRRGIAAVSLGLVAVTGLVVGIVFALGLLVPQLSVEAQEGGTRGNFNNNGPDRLIQAINILNSNPSPDAAEEAINLGMDELMGSRPLPTAAMSAAGDSGGNDGVVGGDGTNGTNGDTDRALVPGTLESHQRFSEREQMFAQALERYISRGGRNAEHQGLALNAKQILEETTQIAQTLSLITAQCGPGDFVLQGGVDNSFNPCAQLQPLMNSSTGLENEPVFTPSDTVFGQGHTFQPIDPLTRSYSVNLRGDLVPPRWSRDIPEHVEITEPLAPGECSVVFKEFRGLLMQLHIETITTVKDPGNKSGLSGTTTEPLWVLRWMPAQYGKQWSMCNTGTTGSPTVTTTVTRQVVEDEGLIYFWRFYE